MGTIRDKMEKAQKQMYVAWDSHRFTIVSVGQRMAKNIILNPREARVVADFIYQHLQVNNEDNKIAENMRSYWANLNSGSADWKD